MISDSVNKNIIAQNKQWIILLVKLLIAFGIFYYLIISIEYKKLLTAVKDADVILIASAFVLSFINIYLQFIKWKITCKAVISESKNSRVFTSLFYGFSAGSFTPARIGEYFGRAIAFKDKPLIQVTVATLLDKFFPLMIVAFIGSVAGILFLHFYYQVSYYLTLAMFIVLFTLFYFLIMVIRNEKFWDSVFFTKLKYSRRFKNLYLQLRTLNKLDRSYFTRMSIISLLFYFCFIVQYAILVAAFSHNSELLNYLWAGNLIMFAKTIIPPISLGELGIREGASVFFLTTFGELSSVAFNASIILFIINILFPALAGLVLLAKKNDD